MFKADDYRLKIKALGETLGEAKYALDIDNRAEELKKLKEEQEKPEVWQDLERSAKIAREISSIQGKVNAYEAGKKALDDASEIVDLIEETEEEESERIIFPTFRLSEEEIESYLSTEEWQGAAGGYRLQKTGYTLIERIDGDWTTVVGLPFRAILDRLQP